MWKKMEKPEGVRVSSQHDSKPPHPFPSPRSTEARGAAAIGWLVRGRMLCFVAALLIGVVSEGLAQETKAGSKSAEVSEQAKEKPAKAEVSGTEQKPAGEASEKSKASVEKANAAESKSAEPAKKSAEQAKVMEAAEQLQKALAEWRKELGPEGKIDAETSAELQGKLRAIGGELRFIMMAAQRQTTPKAQATTAPPNAPVAAKVKQWVTDIRALGPGAEERRAAALEAVKKALTDKDLTTQLAALRTLTETGDIVYDRTPYRPIVLKIVETARGPTLMAALYALYNVGRQPEDLPLVQEAYARDPKALEQSISHLLFSFGAGLIEGKSEEIILTLLASNDRNTVRETLRGLWGAIVTPKLADKLIELADQPATHHEAIYFGLSTLKQKNEAVIDKLIETLSDPDWTNDGQRALWGLGYGIPKDHQLKVAAALVDLHNSRSDARTRRTCEDLVQRYGGDVMAAKLVRE